MENFKLGVGFDYNGEFINKMSIAETGSEAEVIYTKKPSSSNLYSWFASVIAVSVASIGDEVVSSKFLKDETRQIPAVIKAIPMSDVASLMTQIQSECWEDVIKEQQIMCKHCGTQLTTDIDLKELVFEQAEEVRTEFLIPLNKTYKINVDLDIYADYNGHEYSHALVRVPTLGDAIRHESVAGNDVVFWRNIGFDVLKGLTTVAKDPEESEGLRYTYVPEGFITKIGKQLFSKYWTAKTLKAFRDGLQSTLPLNKMYYEDKCSACDKETPYFADTNTFFS